MTQALYQAWQRDRDKTEVPPYSPQMLVECSAVGNNDFFKWYFEQQVDSIKAEDLGFLFHKGRVNELKIIEEIPSNISPLEFDRLAFTTPVGRIDAGNYVYWLMARGIISFLELPVIVTIVTSLISDIQDSIALHDFLYCLTLMQKEKRRACVNTLIYIDNQALDRIMSEVGLIEPVTIIGTPFPTRATLQVYRPPTRQDTRLGFDLIKAVGTESNYESIINYIAGIDDIYDYSHVFLSYLLNADDGIPCPETLSNDKILIYFLHSDIPSYDRDDPHEITHIIYMIIYYGSNKLVEELAELFDKSEDEEPSPYHDIYITALRRSLQSLAYAARLSKYNSNIARRYELVLRRLGKNIKVKQECHLEILKYDNSPNIGSILLQEINEELFKCRGIVDLMILGDQILSLIIENSDVSSRKMVWNILNANLGLVGEATLGALLQSSDIFSPLNPLGMKILTPFLREYIAINKRKFITEVIKKFCYLKHEDLQNLLHIIIPHVTFVDKCLILGSRTYTRRDGVLLEYTESYPPIPCTTCQKSVGDQPRTRPGDSHGIFYCADCSTETQVASCTICMSSDELKLQVLSCKHVVCTECLAKIEVCALCRTNINLGRKHTVTQQEAIDHFMSNFA